MFRIWTKTNKNKKKKLEKWERIGAQKKQPINFIDYSTLQCKHCDYIVQSTAHH